MTHSDVLVHSERGGIEDEITVVEIPSGKAQDASLLSEFYHPVFGCISFTRWRARLMKLMKVCNNVADKTMQRVFV